MEREISILGWVLIIFTALLVVSLFVSLFSRLKEKDKEEKWITAIRNAGNTLRDPFSEENRKIQELAHEVDKLRETTRETQINNNGALDTGEKE